MKNIIDKILVIMYFIVVTTVGTGLIFGLPLYCGNNYKESRKLICEYKLLGTVEVRVDDDSEYHMNGDNICIDDLNYDHVKIIRSDVSKPQIYQMRSQEIKKGEYPIESEWYYHSYDYRLILPKDYIIERFND